MIISPELEARDITVYMDSLFVLDKISLHICSEEFVTILGPSGCGKSTLFSVIAGLIKPTSGSVYLHGKSVTGTLGLVSYMTQKDLLLPWRSILDNVSLPLVLQGESWQNARKVSASYFSLFGLKGFEKSYPMELSGGMKQRAALLRTILFRKSVLLLDEPFGRLDAITKHTMQNWLLEIAQKMKATILMITHDVEEALYLSDRLYVLSKLPGKILEEIQITLPKPRNSTILASKDAVEFHEKILSLL